jgi:glycosyltransferase involved in cell wall biosynthesis
MAKRLKVLISAYACSPLRGSEPGVGWGFIKALAEHHDLWILTEKEKFQAEVEIALQKDPKLASKVQFHFIQKKRNRTLRKIWPPSYYRYYRRWHWDAFLFAQQLHEKVGFDLAHQLTMVGFREPGYLWQLDIPFVWGPVGGIGFFPWRFLTEVGLKGSIYYIGYNCINFLHSHFLPRPKKAAKKAGQGLITATPENQAGALNYWGCNSMVMTEVGLPCPVSSEISRRAEGESLKIVWTGLHVPRKALGLTLKGLSLLDREINWELHVLGKGEKTERWKNNAQQQGIADRCHFHGWLTRQDALSVMQTSHVLLITSLRDLTSTVTIEALALGVPIICLDHCGFSHVVTSECGIKIPVTSPRQVAAEIAASIKQIWGDEVWRQDLASGALHRADFFSWEKKAKQIDGIYKKVIVSP